ncbi:hypothetical protein CDAR_526861 [Caerostris darwini]|uniref:Uncharacterized protein n=1 Tax=Caerostris darwini TaxID=1538125 RepID=A0AAV4Q6I6_9ARAC|nr:hypothetical protein CDAR_526861 [Caerostris darwini]
MSSPSNNYSPHVRCSKRAGVIRIRLSLSATLGDCNSKISELYRGWTFAVNNNTALEGPLHDDRGSSKGQVKCIRDSLLRPRGSGPLQNRSLPVPYRSTWSFHLGGVSIGQEGSFGFIWGMTGSKNRGWADWTCPAGYLSSIRSGTFLQEKLNARV